jgi:hypothetical protein
MPSVRKNIERRNVNANRHCEESRRLDEAISNTVAGIASPLAEFILSQSKGSGSQ